MDHCSYSNKDAKNPFYNGDRNYPVWSWHQSVALSAEDTFNTIVTASVHKLYKSTPKGVAHNCTFLIDVTSLSHPRDIFSDDSGAWECLGCPSTYYSMKCDRQEQVISIQPCGKKKRNIVAENSTHRVLKNYSKNKSSQDFRRVIYTAFSLGKPSKKQDNDGIPLTNNHVCWQTTMVMNLS